MKWVLLFLSLASAMSISTKRIAILGGGPIGLEAALSSLKLNYHVTLFERGTTAANVASWGHVRLFSPNSLNVSPSGLEALAAQGVAAPNMDEFPLGSELISQYLQPVERFLRASGCRMLFNTEVLSVGRGIGKGQSIGGTARRNAKFDILVSCAQAPAQVQVQEQGQEQGQEQVQAQVQGLCGRASAVLAPALRVGGRRCCWRPFARPALHPPPPLSLLLSLPLPLPLPLPLSPLSPLSLALSKPLSPLGEV